MKTLLNIDNNGKIISIIETNDDSFTMSDDMSMIDITDHAQKKDLIQNSNKFNIKKGVGKNFSIHLVKDIPLDMFLPLPQTKKNNIIDEIELLKKRIEVLEKKSIK